LTDNCWTDDANDMFPLTFPTEADARAAYIQAQQMYGERVARREEAMARLGLGEE
jgi:hypothetical protein